MSPPWPRARGLGSRCNLCSPVCTPNRPWSRLCRRRRRAFDPERAAAGTNSRGCARALRTHHVFRTTGKGAGSDGVPASCTWGGFQQGIHPTAADAYSAQRIVSRSINRLIDRVGLYLPGDPQRAPDWPPTVHHADLPGPAATPEVTPNTTTPRRRGVPTPDSVLGSQGLAQCGVPRRKAGRAASARGRDVGSDRTEFIFVSLASLPPPPSRFHYVLGFGFLQFTPKRMTKARRSSVQLPPFLPLLDKTSLRDGKWLTQ